MIFKSTYSISKHALETSIPEPIEVIKKTMYYDFLKQLMASDYFKIKEEDMGDSIKYSTDFTVLNEQEAFILMKKILRNKK